MRRLCFWMFGAVLLCAKPANAQQHSLHLKRKTDVAGLAVQRDTLNAKSRAAVRRSALIGATMGGAAGFVIGGVLVNNNYSESNNCAQMGDPCGTAAFKPLVIAIGAVGGGILGTAVGGFLGYVIADSKSRRRVGFRILVR